MNPWSALFRPLLQERVTDFLMGLGLSASRPAAFATAAGRPELTETQAADFSPWPGRTAEYDGQGNLCRPERVLFGQNVLVGLALSFAEVRAWLAGLTQPKGASRELAVQYFRAGRGLALVLAELLAQGGLTQADYLTAYYRLFLGSSVRAVTDTEVPADGKLYVAKRLASGHVALATGAEDEDGDAVIGVFARPAKAGALALVATAGTFIAWPHLPAGKLYRAPDATLATYGALADGSSTTFVGIGSALGLDVRVIQAEEVDQS